jgi:alpha-amylase
MRSSVFVLGAGVAASEQRTGAFVHLFEWKWSDIALECEQFLGPMGFDAVQTSPQMEHIQGDAWWTRYQPVTYNTVSRSGSEDDFKEMVSRCAAVGVGIIADPVPNHMAAGGGTGIAGSSFGNRQYPFYGPQDLHHDNNNKLTNCQVNNYQDKYNVQHCDLVGLPDLDTGASYVQGQLSGYFKKLLGYGVTGIRIDAAKHQDPGEIHSYLQQAGNPWVFQEVIWGNNEAVQPEQYTGNGAVTEFRWALTVSSAIRDGNAGALSNLDNGLLSSYDSVIFLDNHDTERGGAPMTYKNGDSYRVANYFMLAHPFGYPKIMSGYYFDDHDQGPPSQGVHQDGKLNCFYGNGPWVCTHRWSGVGEMVGFRNAVKGEGVSDWNVAGNRQLSFSRGKKGFFAMHFDNGNWDAWLHTSLPAGQYCDVIQGLETCHPVTVQEDGSVHVSMGSFSAVALHVNATPENIGVNSTTF